MPETEPIHIRPSKRMVKKIDEMVDNGLYKNRNEFIIDAIRRLLFKAEGGPKHENRH